MDIKQFKCDVVDSNSWLMVKDKHALLIDAVLNNDLMKRLEYLDDLVVILTHAHFDHIIGLNYIRKLVSNTKVISTALCSEYMGSVYKNMSSVATTYISMAYGINDNTLIKPFTCEKSDMIFDKEIVIDWYGNEIKLKSVQGHSKDGLIVIFNNELLFSGDTLLNHPTVTKFPTGNSKRFWDEDIPFLKSLSHIKLVYPGHGDSNEINTMLQFNIMP